MGGNETKTVSVEEALKAVNANRVKREIDLPSGKKAVIFKGKGRDSNAALKDAGDDSSQYLLCLMARLIEIDGKPVIPEELEELELKDYTTLQTEFATENF